MSEGNSGDGGMRRRLSEATKARTYRAWSRISRRPLARLFEQELIVRTGNFGRTSWAGIPIWQNVLDLWTIQETLTEIRPALLIETGTHHGGSATFYAHVMEILGAGRVLTIDIVDKHEIDHPRVEFLHGSSTDPQIVERVHAAAAKADGAVMVILDGNHDRDHVAAELELYGPLVTPGSYLLSQDGVIDRIGLFADSRPGPLDANRDFLARHPEFEHDRERNERFVATHHPLGWMRRRPDRVAEHASS